MPNPNLPLQFDPQATYVISGGLGGLGRSIAHWMLQRGARNFILLSRATQHSEAVQKFLADMRAHGAVVATPPCDISNQKSVQGVIEECGRTLPPIKGCIQGAMVLEVRIGLLHVPLFKDMTLIATERKI